jgi:predicted RNA-binding Zn ribbon-like protein
MSKRQKPSKNSKIAIVVEPGIPRSVALDLPARFQAANERVGDEPAERLDWLVSQLGRSDEELRNALLQPVSDFRLELARFGNAAHPWETGSAEEILEAFASLRETLKNFRPDFDATLTFPIAGTITKYFSVTPKRRRVRWSGAIESHYFSDHFPTAFLLAAAEVLEEEGLRVRQCARPGCGRLFTHRKRGLFCSTSCSQKVRDQRFRERHSSKALLERRHSEQVGTAKETLSKASASKARTRRPTGKQS